MLLEGPQQTTGSIGQTWKTGNGRSRLVLTGQHKHTPPPPPPTPREPRGGRNKKGNTTPPHQGGTPHRAQPRVHYADHHQPTPHPPEQTNETAGGPEDHNHPQHHRATPTRAPHHPTTRLGGHSGEATPGPIPNPEAKTPSANGTAPARTRKSRTPPSTHHPPTTHTKRRPGENKQQPDVLSRSSDRAYVRLHGPPLLREYPIRP